MDYHDAACCRVIVENDVLQTREEFLSPQSVDDTLANHGAVGRAVRWQQHYDPEDEHLVGFPENPIAVAVHVDRGESLITVRWHATGPADEARRAMFAVFADSYYDVIFGADGHEAEGGAV